VKAGPKAAVDGSRLPFRSKHQGGERFAAFCREYVVVPKGHGALRRLRPRPWQVELVDSVWGAEHSAPSGAECSRPRLAGWMLGRGNGKTSLAGALALYDLLLGPEGASIIVVATDERQAGLCMRAATRMVELHPELESRVQTYARQLVVPSRGATFTTLPAAPKRLEGQDFTLAILDEFGRMGREVYEVILGASGKRPASTAVGIGTPPLDPAESVLTAIRDYTAEHPEDSSVVWREHSAAGFNHHPVDCRHCWTLANPALNDFLAEDGLTACLPPKMRESSFRRARLCQLVDEVADPWLPPGAWDACRISSTRVETNAEVVLAFDGSFNADCTCIVACSVGEIPQLELLELWEAPEASRDWRVPVLEVEEAIRLACRRYRVRAIVADPYRWQRSLELLDGEGLPVEEFPQSPQRMTPATSRFYEAVVNGALSHSGDPRLARHLSNAVLKEDPRGARLSKEHKHSKRRIDAAVAAVMALHRASELAAAPGVQIYV
jgi:phage terminase large subunit-like protein